MNQDLLSEGFEGVMGKKSPDDSVTELNAMAAAPPTEHPQIPKYVYNRGHNRWNIATFITVATAVIGALVYYTTFIRSDEKKENRIEAVEKSVGKVHGKVEKMDKRIDDIHTEQAVMSAEQRSISATLNRIEDKLNNP